MQIMDQAGGALLAPLSSLVGRRRARTEVATLLASRRLVTLVGPPGVGKSRLALHVAADVAHDNPDGVYLVDVAALEGTTSTARAVASALSLGEQPDPAIFAALRAHLAAKRVLLVLDNCDHLVCACADLAGALVQACPRLTVLATSRQPLGLVGEATWSVPPLPVPNKDVGVSQLSGNESVRLFMERVPVAGFEMADAARSIADTCRRLDGIPLAIELAARRVGFLTPDEVADQLDHRFRLLASSDQSLLTRHRSLRAALDWSYDLLSVPERVLLRRLAVFASSFTLDTASEVLKGDDISGDEILDLLARLVAMSLVVSETRGCRTRYRLLESIRLYAAEKLTDAGEEAMVQDANARWCADFVERVDAELCRGPQADRLGELEAVYVHLRVALDWSVFNDGDLGLRLAGGLVRFWLLQGRLGEGRDWLEQALATGSGSAAKRAQALWGLGLMACMLGDLTKGLASAEEALVVARSSGDNQTAARALNLLGVCRIFTDPGAAPGDLANAVALARRADDPSCLAGSLAMLGFAHALCGDLSDAVGPLEESLTTCPQLGEGQYLAVGLVGLGYVALKRGDGGEARKRLERGLAVARGLGDSIWAAVTLAFLAEVATNEGDHGQARALAGEGERLAREAGATPVLALCLTALGYAHLAAGHHDRALSAFDEAVPLSLAGGHGGVLARALAGVGRAHLGLGDCEAARPFLEDAVEAAESSKDRVAACHGLHWLGHLARSQGDRQRAEDLHLQAVCVQIKLGHRPGVAESLEALAGLAIQEGELCRAARLLGAAASVREEAGCSRRTDQDTYLADVGHLEQELPATALAAAWAAGRRMPAEDAIDDACRGRPRPHRPPSGWARLTKSERQIAQLAASGLSNPEIGERLYISRRTVQTHLTHVYAKLGLGSRGELAQEVRHRRVGSIHAR